MAARTAPPAALGFPLRDALPPLSGASLLFRQFCLLAGAAGVLASRELLPGLFCLIALLFLARQREPLWAHGSETLDERAANDTAQNNTAPCGNPVTVRKGVLFRSRARLSRFTARHGARIGIVCLCFVCGLGYAALRVPQEAPRPAWLAAALAPAPDGKGEERPPAPVRLRAEVAEATPLPGNRLRLLLRNARPAKAAARTTPEAARGHAAFSPPPASITPSPLPSSEAYAGLIAWTWTFPGGSPLRGQEVELTTRLSPARGLSNPGGWDMERYWQDRGVWIRGWSRGEKAALTVSGPPAEGAERHDRLFRRFVAALPEKKAQADRGDAFKAPQPDISPQAPAFTVPAAEEGAEPEGRRTPPGGNTGLQGGSGPAGNEEPSASEATPEGGLQQEFFRPALTEGAALLPALIFGDRSFISPENSELVARATLAHSLALSGLHLGYAAGLGYLLALGLGRLFPPLWLRISRPRLTLLLALPLAGGYLWLGQAPVSLVRAGLMLLFWTALLFLNKPKVMLDGLLAAVAVILLLDPASLFDLSLQLSALSVAAIALCLPRLTAGVDRLLSFLCGPRDTHPSLARRAARGGLLLLGISCCIQIALAPLTVRAFGTLGLWFPLNLLWLPVLGCVVMPLAFAGLLLSALGLAAPAALALLLASLPCEGLLSLLHALDSANLLAVPVVARPHWLSMAGYWILCLALPSCVAGAARALRQPHTGARMRSLRFLLSRRPLMTSAEAPAKLPPRNAPAAAVACLGLILLLVPFGLSSAAGLFASGKSPVTLRLLDVGQGQSVLVEWTTGRPGRMLIDGGGTSSATFDPGRAILAPVLTDSAPPHLELLVNSHPDTDHLGGLLYLLEQFSIARYAGNGDFPVPALATKEAGALSRSGLQKEIWAAGDTIALAPDLHLEVLWPPKNTASPVSAPGTGPSRGAISSPAAVPASTPAPATGNSPDAEPSLPGAAEAPPARAESSNNNSLILRLVWQGRGLALICGDAEQPALQSLIAGHETSRTSASQPFSPNSVPGQAQAFAHAFEHTAFPAPGGSLQAEVLVVPHHGSGKSHSPALYDAVAPRLALVACGYGNQWGFPSASVRSSLQARGIPLYSTARHGHIRVEWRSHDLPATLETMHSGAE